MKNVRKTISIPKDEINDFQRAKERIAQAYGEIMISDSQAFRIGVQAILELDLRRLEMCVEKCPQLTPGREPQKDRKTLTKEETATFFGIKSE